MMCFEVNTMYTFSDAQWRNPLRTAPCRPRTPVNRGPCAAPSPGAPAESVPSDTGGGVVEVKQTRNIGTNLEHDKIPQTKKSTLKVFRRDK